MLHPVAPGPTVVITGASRGLGIATARQLATHGGRVIVTARAVGDAASTAAHLLTEGITVRAYESPLDVSDARSIGDFATFAEDHEVDVLINNAAVCIPGWEHEVVQQTLRTNLLGPQALARALLPGMLERGRGHVLHVSSGDGELTYLHSALQAELRAATSEVAVLRTLCRATPPRQAFGASPAHGLTPAYALSKAGLNALTRIAAARLPAPEVCGVRVSAVCPGDVLTAMCVEEEARRNALTPEAAARDVAWLAVAGLDAARKLPSGRFWRARTQIGF